MRICVVIPTYNEAKSINSLLEQIKLLGISVLVVDDGSSDNTAKLASDSGAVVLRNAKNEGKGASLLNGFKYVVDHNFDAAIAMDGDGQHDPADIKNFMRAAESSESAIFIGNRMLNVKNMPYLRILTNKFMSWLISCIVKQRIPDTQCGYRLIRKEALEKIKLETSKFEIESEMLIKAGRLGFKIESVPINTIYQDELSRINPFLDTVRFIKFILKEIRWTMPR